MAARLTTSRSMATTSFVTAEELRRFLEDVPDSAQISISHVPRDRPFDSEGFSFTVQVST